MVLGNRQLVIDNWKRVIVIGNGIVWYGLVWFGMVWYDLVWYGLVWFGWYSLVWGGRGQMTREFMKRFQAWTIMGDFHG